MAIGIDKALRWHWPMNAVLFCLICICMQKTSAWTRTISPSCRDHRSRNSKGLACGDGCRHQLIGQRWKSTMTASHPSRAIFVSTRDDNNESPFKDDNDDDDGWGDSTSSATKESATTAATTVKESSDVSTINDYRNEQSQRKTNTDIVERDLFIPIFTLTAILGFTGLYVYESLRLYRNGELYFPPWN